MYHESQKNIKEESQFQPISFKRIFTHFKNALHEGYFQTNSMHRMGPSIVLMDNMACILGSYRNDQLNGQTLIYLTHDTYAIAQFDKGVLDGPFVIRSPTITIYSTIKCNKIDGQIVIIDYSSFIGQLWAIEANGMGQLHNQINISHLVYINEDTQEVQRIKNLTIESQILKSLAPYIEKAPSVTEFIKNFKFYGGKKQLKMMPGFVHRVFKHNEIIYLADNDGKYENYLGIVLNKKEEIVIGGSFKKKQIRGNQHTSVSSFDNYFDLNGLAFIVTVEKVSKFQEEKLIEAGLFTHNVLNGQGYQQLGAKKSIFGKFHEGEIRQKDIIKMSSEGDEQAKKLYLKHLKSVHIHSLHFINNYTNERPIFILKNLIQKNINKQ